MSLVFSREISSSTLGLNPDAPSRSGSGALVVRGLLGEGIPLVGPIANVKSAWDEARRIETVGVQRNYDCGNQGTSKKRAMDYHDRDGLSKGSRGTKKSKIGWTR